MNTRITTIALTLACLAATGNVLADCGASGTIAGTRKAFNDGLRFERAGNITSAFAAYIAAQEADLRAEPGRSRCRASRRHAGVAPGQRRRKEGRLPESLRLLRHGRTVRRCGSRADGAGTRAGRTTRTSSARPVRCSTHVRCRHSRATTGFSSPSRARISRIRRTSPRCWQCPPTASHARSRRKPRLSTSSICANTLQRIQSRPDDLTDFEAMQAWGSAQQAFAQKWGDDRLKSRAMN